jgi:hypothetical protein
MKSNFKHLSDAIRTTMILAQGAPVSPYAANYSIVTETGNDNSANIMQTGDKHVCEVTQDGHNYGFVGIKRSVCYSVW